MYVNQIPKKMENVKKNVKSVDEPLKKNNGLLDVEQTNFQKEIIFSDWINSSYLPTPTIIEASKVLYKGHGVSDISRNEAGSDKLGQTSILLNEIIDNSKRNNEKSIILLTGIPLSLIHI